MATLINQLMMSADAWVRLANIDVAGLTPELLQQLYRERMDRATGLRKRAGLARILADGGVDVFTSLADLKEAVRELTGDDDKPDVHGDPEFPRGKI